MVFVEGILERGSAVAGRAKSHLVRLVIRVRFVRKVRRYQTRKVLQQLTGSRFAGEWMQGHGSDPFVPF
jgi:hypothetical protein